MLNPKPESDTYTVNLQEIDVAVRNATRGNRMDRMMEFQTDRASLERLPLEAQARIFLDFAEHDLEETQNFYFLYRDKPYALRVLKKAALKSPENAIDAINRNPDSLVYQELNEFMIRRFGEEAIVRETRASGFTVFNRIKVYGLLKGLFGVNTMRPLENPA